MYKGFTAYLYKGTTVVLKKKNIANAKDEDFAEVQVYLSDEFIRECAEELEMLSDDEEE